jgi:ABC-type Fe3+-hydroxamate transport system substrate-binding protein
MKINLALIIAVALLPASAIAQTNASNSSGANTSSYGGSSGSIWDGNRQPVVTTPEVGTKVFIPAQPATILAKPAIVPVVPPVQRLIPPVACGDEHAACPSKKQPVYKPAIKKAPKARG